MIRAVGSPAESVLVGSSAVMRRVRDTIATLATADSTVRFEGPSGTGKNVAARLLHELSRRARAPFVICSLAALPNETLMLSELFGHKRGAFTGAFDDRMGRCEEAHTGTLFIDEVGAASPEVQVRLLDFLDTKSFCRLGENRRRTVDVRVVCATNEDLAGLVASGRFRADLLYRLGVIVVRMPALAEHAEDIPEIADRMLSGIGRRGSVPTPRLPGEVVARLSAHSWPGNVRELGNVIEHFVVLGRLPDDFPDLAPGDWRARLGYTLREHGGNIAATARALHISRTSLHKELRRSRDAGLAHGPQV